jgi:hypothetical protein
MRLDGEERGSVWCDAAGSDESYTRVAPTFTAWFRAWLDAAVRQSGPWAQWDNRSCATTGLIAKMLEETGQTNRRNRGKRPSLAGAVTQLSMVNGNHLPEVSTMDPCHPCVLLAATFDLPAEVFAPGVLSRREA